MKNILIILCSVIFFLLTGCKEDNIVDPSDTGKTIEQLNNKAAELHKNGYEVVEAARILDKEYTFERKDKLNSLYLAGYSAEEIVKAAKAAYYYLSRNAETILITVLTDKSGSQIAELILSGYVDELKTDAGNLKYFISKIKIIDKQVQLLDELYNKKLPEILEILKQLDENFTLVVQTLINHFNLSEEDVRELLLNLPSTTEEIISVLKNIYHHTASEILNFIKENGYDVTEALSILKDLFNLSITQVTQLLEELGYELPDITPVLRELQYSYNEIAVLLKEYYHLTAAQASGYLKDLGVGAQQIAQILKDVFNNNASEITQILKDLFNSTASQISGILNQLRFSLAEVAGAIINNFNLTVQNIIQTLIDAGFDYCEVLHYFGFPC